MRRDDTVEKKNKVKDGYLSIKMQTVRIMETEKMKDFVKPGGTYEDYLWKMHFHIVAHDVRLFGKESSLIKRTTW